MTEYRETPPVEDRPIQAGDWVEHKTSDVRYQVEHSGVGAMMLRRPNGELLGPVSAAEFERVDGPHPVKHEYDPQHWFECKICDQPTERIYEHQVSGGDGKVERGFCPSCYPTAARVAAQDAMKATERKVAADPYTAHRLKEEARGMGRRKFPNAEGQLAARARNEAALRREAERPRLTADARELAKPHPWEEFE